MKTSTHSCLAEVARKEAMRPFHGNIDGAESNLKPIIDLFPKWNVTEADGM